MVAMIAAGRALGEGNQLQKKGGCDGEKRERGDLQRKMRLLNSN